MNIFCIEKEGIVNDALEFVCKEKNFLFFSTKEIDGVEYFINDLRPNILLIDIETLQLKQKPENLVKLKKALEDFSIPIMFTGNLEIYDLDIKKSFKKSFFLEKPFNPLICIFKAISILSSRI